jgi:hypothetical protein
MATGYTQHELDTLLAIMDESVPPVPTSKEKHDAPRVTAMRAAGTDKGAIFNIETKGGMTEIFWFNCWTAKGLAGAISFASRTYGWVIRGLVPQSSDHLKAPERTDIATEVLSSASLGDRSGILVRLAVGQPIRHKLLFFPTRAALELVLAVAQGGNTAGWWDEDFELIPSQESQH